LAIEGADRGPVLGGKEMGKRRRLGLEVGRIQIGWRNLVKLEEDIGTTYILIVS